MKHGEIWFAETPGGDRPVLILTRDPVAAKIDGVVVAQITTTLRGFISELELGSSDGMDRPCCISFDNINTIRRSQFRRRITQLTPERTREAGRAMNAALGFVD